MKFVHSSLLLLGATYHQASALTPAELLPVARDILDLIPAIGGIDRSDFVGGIVRLAAHDAMGSGGSDGCIDVNAADNNGLAESIAALEPVVAAHSLSKADVWALASILGVRAMGGPAVPFESGRPDCTGVVSGATLLPQSDPAGNTWDHIKSVFVTRLGLSTRDVVALMGAHTIGRAESQNLGFSGSWVDNTDTFDNEYYRDMLNRRWRKRNQGGREVWLDGNRIMLPTDMALAINPDSCNSFGGRNGDTRGCTLNAEGYSIVQEYANDGNLWHRDYASAYAKLLRAGVTSPLTPVSHLAVGEGYCAQGFQSGVRAVSNVGDCEDACSEAATCTHYAFCPPGSDACMGDNSAFCALYNTAECTLTNDLSDGYTAYTFLQGPAIATNNRGNGGNGDNGGNGGGRGGNGGRGGRGGGGGGGNPPPPPPPGNPPPPPPAGGGGGGGCGGGGGGGSGGGNRGRPAGGRRGGGRRG